MKKLAAHEVNDMDRPDRNFRHRIIRHLALALTIALLPAGCSLIPEDMAPTVPGAVSEITTDPAGADIVGSPLLITEIMSTNASTLQAADQSTPDWIEIHNSGSSSISLTGYCLSDNLKKPDKWIFPDITLPAGGYLLLYADGETSTAEGEIHTSFRLNAEGDDLILTSPAGQVLARISIPELPADVSYGLAPAAVSALDPYYYYGAPTPGTANGDDGQTTAEAAIPRPQYSLDINEYMTDNRSFTDADGDLPDWVELRNTGNEPLNLLGFQLSDDPDDPGKWVFPDVTVEAGAVLVVWLSGKDKIYDPADPTSLQASFRLGADDVLLVLTDPKGHPVIVQDLEDLPANVSKGRSADTPDSWLYFPQATPGAANTTAGFAEISGAVTLRSRGVWINEVLAQNASMSGDTKVGQPDWIELYNGSGRPVSLDGFGLSDDSGDRYRMKLDGLSIGAGEYLVIQPAGFGLSISAETLYLTAPGNLLVDWFDTGSLRNGVSSGRGNAGGEEPADARFFYVTPTPGAPNATAASSSIALAPQIKVTPTAGGEVVSGLYFDGSVTVTLSSSQTGATLRYTLDGSLPTTASPAYQSPLTVSDDTVIRCIAELPGSLASEDVSRTLLTGDRHDLPVVSLAVAPDDFTGPSGVWSDYLADHEARVSVSFFEADGTAGVSFAAGVALHGSFSRKEIQKSLELNLRACYGDDQVIYPFFPDNEVSTFKRLILRTSGQDWRISKLRDAFMSEAVEGQLDIDTMDWRPCVLYVNGEYYGLYEVRENIDEYYMAAHTGIDPDNVDIIKGNAIVLSGSTDRYKALIQYVRDHDLTDPAAYQYVLSQIDEQSLIDWIIAETFFNNGDSGNKKFWRENIDGAEWHWAFFDLDWAMFSNTYTWNMISGDLFDPEGHGSQNIFSTVLQCKLIANPDFKDMFIERYAELLNTTFQTDRLTALLDQMQATISSEMPRQIARWGGPSTVEAWERNVATLRRIVTEKRALTMATLQESFSISAERMRELFPEDY